MIELPQIKHVPRVQDCFAIHIFHIVCASSTGGGDDVRALPIGAELSIGRLGGIEGDLPEHQVTDVEASGLKILFPLLDESLLIGS